MKPSIKKIQGIVLSQLVIFSLAACSSSPSPWSQADESPWKAKRDAEKASTTADEFIAVPVEEEPVMAEPMPVMVEPEPITEPEPMPVMAEPEPMPEPEAEPVTSMVPVTGIMGMSASGYAVQVYAGKTESSVKRYQDSHGLQDMMIVKTEREGVVHYVLVSAHDDRAAANQAAVDIEQITGAKPWVRSISGLQRIAIN